MKNSAIKISSKVGRSIALSLAISAASAFITACGGGGSKAPPPTPLSQADHDSLAAQFVAESAAENVPMTLVKADTLKAGYIVTSDSTGNLVAYYIDGWTAGSSVSYYLLNGTDGEANFSGLTANSDGTYSVMYGNNNVVFEAAQPSQKDLQKLAAFKQQFQLEASAQKIQTKFGLSLERATEVAKLAIQVKNTSKMTAGDYDSLSQQLLGVPVAKLDQAVQQHQRGDDSITNEIINQAATTNGVGVEQARSLMESLGGH